MCLAVPGRILAISCTHTSSSAPHHAGLCSSEGCDALEGDLWRVAEVDFGGVRQQVSLACLPQARVGDRVLVHVGFALSLVDDDGEPSP